MKNKVRDRRIEKDLTQSGLADACGVSRQTIISIETDRYEPTTRLALKIAKALKCRVEDLFQLEAEDYG